MKHSALQNLFARPVTRKQFLGIGALAIASLFGIVGLIEELKSHAATPFVNIEPETGSATGGATVVTDTTASGGKAIHFAQPSSPTNNNPPPAGAQLTADFRSTTHTLDKWSVGSTISTYSGNGQGNINASASWRAKLTALGPLAWRVPLRYNNGNPGSSAGGAQTSGNAATYITNIRAMGGTPYPIIGGNNSDNSEAASDVSGLVHYFNDNNGARAGGKLERLIIGNEPENASAGPAYISALAGLAAAAKGADSAILVAAPASAYWDSSLLQQAAGVKDVDILGYHAYDGGNTDGTGFPNTSQYHTHMADMMAMGKSLVGCEEVNWHFDYSNMSAFYDWHNLCFIASIIGQVITGGGHVNHYSDSNGPLGLLNDGSGQNQPGNLGDPLPAYWGIGMWTGMNGQFRRFGTHTVPATSSVGNVDCFATDNGKVLIVNKDTSAHAVTLGLGGKGSGVYSVWQTVQSAPTAAPKKVVSGAAYNSSLVSLNLPAGTVSSVEID